MAPEESLASIAEIGIGLAGFSGLVAAFVQHSGSLGALIRRRASSC